jgi:hypothetical protein
MTNRPRTQNLLILSLLTLASLFIISGCSDSSDPVATNDPVTVDIISTTDLAADPLDDVLQSTDGTTPAEPQGRIDRLTEVLDLTEEQAVALEEAYLEFRTALEDLREQCQNEELTIEEARAAAALLREDFEAALQLILTPEQYDLLQEMRQNRHGPRIGHRHHEPRWEAWLAEIGADETQVETILAALETMRTEIQDLRAEVRADEITNEEARAAIEILRADFDTLLQDTLTVEQYEALLDLRPDCGNRGR